MSTTHEHASFRVGDRVKIDFGRHKLTGIIVEARGAIGVRGRHLFRVEVPMDPYDPMTLELPEDDIEAVPSDEQTPKAIDKARIIEYLKMGGLISILQSNISGGRNQPRAWLCLDNLGNITHTFSPERGVIGGQVVPGGAVRDNRIFLAKRASVAGFLASFGLDDRDVEKVISDVGTAH